MNTKDFIAGSKIANLILTIKNDFCFNYQNRTKINYKIYHLCQNHH